MKASKSRTRGLAEVSHLFLSGSEPRKEKVTIRMAAKVLDVSRGTIVSYLNEGLLTRIKEGGNIYIAIDEVTALSETNKKPRAESSVSKSAETIKRAPVSKKKERPKGTPASLGLLESEREYLLECKAALEAKDKELENLQFQVNNLKGNLETQSRELAGTKSKLGELEKYQQERLVDFESRANVDNQDLLQKIEARLLVVEEELKRLRRPSWWKELRGQQELRSGRSMKKEVMLFGTLALFAVLIFSLWWVNRSPQQPPLPVTEGQTSESVTAQPNPHSATLNDQTPRAYSSSVEEAPTWEEQVSPVPEVEQQVVGLSSPPPPYVLRAETLAPTWLHVVIDERQELEYLLQPAEKHTWRAMSGFRLHIGNAAGLQLHLNDQPLKPLGERDQVVHLKLPDPSLIDTPTPNTPSQ